MAWTKLKEEEGGNEWIVLLSGWLKEQDQPGGGGTRL